MCLPHTADSSMKNSQWIAALWRSGDCRMIQAWGPHCVFCLSLTLFGCWAAGACLDLGRVICYPSQGFTRGILKQRSLPVEWCISKLWVRWSQQWFLIYTLAWLLQAILFLGKINTEPFACATANTSKKRGEGIPKGMGTQRESLDTWSQQVQPKMELGIPSAACRGEWGPEFGEERGGGVLILNTWSWSTGNSRQELSFQVSELDGLGV